MQPVTITDAALVHLAGIHAFHMTGCNQRAITDAAFEHLAGIFLAEHLRVQPSQHQRHYAGYGKDGRLVNEAALQLMSRYSDRLRNNPAAGI